MENAPIEKKNFLVGGKKKEGCWHPTKGDFPNFGHESLFPLVGNPDFTFTGSPSGIECLGKI